MKVEANILKKIQAHALGALRMRSDVQFNEVNLHLNTEALPQGHKMVQGLNRTFTLQRHSVVVLADTMPLYNWGHPCEHHLYDAKTGDYYDTQHSQFPPEAWFNEPHKFQALHTPVKLPEGVMADFPKTIPHLSDAISKASGKRYAILFSGMSNNRHLNDLEFIYRTLVDIYHFTPANITVLNYNGTVNYSGGPQPVANWPGDNSAYRIVVNGSGTNTALAQALDKVKTKLKSGDMLFIHTNNHGGGQPSDPQAWLCCYPNWASYTASDFGTKLHTLPQFNSLIVMMEQCHSGGFRDAVINNSTATNTSFAAACTFNASSAGGADFDPYARDWIAGVTGHNPNGGGLSRSVPVPASARDAFIYANAVKVAFDSPVFADKPTNIGTTQFLTGPLNVSFAAATAAINSDGRLEVFLRASNGAVWNIWQTVPHSGPWSNLNSLGGIIKQAPVTALNTDGRLEIFGIGTNNAAYNDWQLAAHAGPWSGWSRRGGIVSQITAARNSDGRLELFGIGTDGALYNMWQTAPHAGPWSGWNRLGGVVKQIAAAINSDGRLEVFGIGSDNALWHIWQTAPHSGPWSGWSSRGGVVKQITTALNSDGRLEVFAIGSDNALWHIWQTAPHSGPWSGWSSRGGVVKQITATSNSDGRLEVFGIGSDNGLWNIWQTVPHSGPWSGWHKLA